MRILTVVSLSLFLVACGKAEVPDAGAADAGPIDSGSVAPPVCLPDTEDAGDTDAGLDFSCLGHPLGTGGQAELVITGKATRAGFVRTPMPGIQLDLLTLDGTVLATTISDDAGTYRLSYDAGCYPLDGEVRATHPPDDAGFALSYNVPGEPWRFDRKNLELVMFDSSTQGLAAGIANVMLVDGGAVLAMTVEDCLGNPVQAALVSVAGGGVVRYVGAAGLPVTTQTSTAASGDLVIFNILGTSADVTATYDGGVIGHRVIPVHAGAATGTFLSP